MNSFYSLDDKALRSISSVIKIAERFLIESCLSTSIAFTDAFVALPTAKRKDSPKQSLFSCRITFHQKFNFTSSISEFNLQSKHVEVHNVIALMANRESSVKKPGGCRMKVDALKALAYLLVVFAARRECARRRSSLFSIDFL